MNAPDTIVATRCSLASPPVLMALACVVACGSAPAGRASMHPSMNAGSRTSMWIGTTSSISVLAV